MMRIILLICIFAAVFGVSLFAWQEESQAPLVLPEEETNEEKITLLFVGDIMLDRGVEYYIEKNGGDWRFPFLNIADFLKKADLVFGNLESVISDKGEKQGSIYSFRADPRALEGLVFAGFDVLSVTNNHSLDYGMDALLDSISRVEDADIATLGAGINKQAAQKLFVKETRGTKIGMLAYTNTGSPLWEVGESTFGVAWVDEHNLAEFSQRIKDAKKEVDVLVVSIHFGEEYQKEPSATQELIAKTAVGSGADMVVGHHPHVIQPLVQYQQGWIAYSLGNFVFDQGFSKETMQGLLLEVIVQDKKITRVSPRPINLNYLFQPILTR
ncbi:MAG: CapA family protein [Candidatus Wildermuthbacteria bacterium]|nr:CapA family protein [Candidatus Wildermuthbacteria bacterium]